MRVILCDRCGARIENKNTVGFVGLRKKEIKSGDIVGTPLAYEDWDICDDCMKQIEEFVRIKPVPMIHIQTAPSAEEVKNIIDDLRSAPITVLPNPDPVKPKATIKKPMPARITPEQIEQIRTMVKEGHSVNTIAELVGVSAPTVRKYKKELEDETMDSEE